VCNVPGCFDCTNLETALQQWVDFDVTSVSRSQPTWGGGIFRTSNVQPDPTQLPSDITVEGKRRDYVCPSRLPYEEETQAGKSWWNAGPPCHAVDGDIDTTYFAFWFWCDPARLGARIDGCSASYETCAEDDHKFSYYRPRRRHAPDGNGGMTTRGTHEYSMMTPDDNELAEFSQGWRPAYPEADWWGKYTHCHDINAYVPNAYKYFVVELSADTAHVQVNITYPVEPRDQATCTDNDPVSEWDHMETNDCGWSRKWGHGLKFYLGNDNFATMGSGEYLGEWNDATAQSWPYRYVGTIPNTASSNTVSGRWFFETKTLTYNTQYLYSRSERLYTQTFEFGTSGGQKYKYLYVRPAYMTEDRAGVHTGITDRGSGMGWADLNVRALDVEQELQQNVLDELDILYNGQASRCYQDLQVEDTPATNVKQFPIDLWDVSKVTRVNYLFNGDADVGDLSRWMLEETVLDNDFGDKWTVKQLFHSAMRTAKFYDGDNWMSNQLWDMAQWDVSEVTDMTGAFKDMVVDCSVIADWDVSKVTAFDDMFSNATLQHVDRLAQWSITPTTPIGFVSTPGWCALPEAMPEATFQDILNSPGTSGYPFQDYSWKQKCTYPKYDLRTLDGKIRAGTVIPGYLWTPFYALTKPYRERSLQPMFVDIDGDGDMDMFEFLDRDEDYVYDFDAILWYKNRGDPFSPAFANNIGIGTLVEIGTDRNAQKAAHRGTGLMKPQLLQGQFADANQDGKMDFFGLFGYNKIVNGVWDLAVDLRLHLNQGTVTEPDFKTTGQVLLTYNPSGAQMDTQGFFVQDVDDDGDLDFYLFTGDVNLYVNNDCTTGLEKRAISSCTASSAHPGGYICDNAFDGVVSGGSGDEWATHGEGTGSWIQLNFAEAVSISQMKFANRVAAERSKEVELEFSGGQTTTVTLLDNANLNTFDLGATFVTTSVKITVLTVHSTYNNGALEIEFWGPTPCSEGRVYNLVDVPVLESCCHPEGCGSQWMLEDDGRDPNCKAVINNGDATTCTGVSAFYGNPTGPCTYTAAAVGNFWKNLNDITSSGIRTAVRNIYYSIMLLDYDLDGDMDMFIGATNGRIYFFERTNECYGRPVPYWAAERPIRDHDDDYAPNPFAGIDVGVNAVPVAVDIDGDGDLDVMVGHRDGIAFIENVLGVYVHRTVEKTLVPTWKEPGWRSPEATDIPSLLPYAANSALQGVERKIYSPHRIETAGGCSTTDPCDTPCSGTCSVDNECLGSMRCFRPADHGDVLPPGCRWGTPPALPYEESAGYCTSDWEYMNPEILKDERAIKWMRVVQTYSSSIPYPHYVHVQINTTLDTRSWCKLLNKPGICKNNRCLSHKTEYWPDYAQAEGDPYSPDRNIKMKPVGDEYPQLVEPVDCELAWEMVGIAWGLESVSDFCPNHEAIMCYVGNGLIWGESCICTAKKDDCKDWHEEWYWKTRSTAAKFDFDTAQGVCIPDHWEPAWSNELLRVGTDTEVLTLDEFLEKFPDAVTGTPTVGWDDMVSLSDIDLDLSFINSHFPVSNDMVTNCDRVCAEKWDIDTRGPNGDLYMFDEIIQNEDRLCMQDFVSGSDEVSPGAKLVSDPTGREPGAIVDLGYTPPSEDWPRVGLRHESNTRVIDAGLDDISGFYPPLPYEPVLDYYQHSTSGTVSWNLPSQSALRGFRVITKPYNLALTWRLEYSTSLNGPWIFYREYDSWMAPQMSFFGDVTLKTTYEERDREIGGFVPKTYCFGGSCGSCGRRLFFTPPSSSTSNIATVAENLAAASDLDCCCSSGSSRWLEFKVLDDLSVRRVRVKPKFPISGTLTTIAQFEIKMPDLTSASVTTDVSIPSASAYSKNVDTTWWGQRYSDTFTGAMIHFYPHWTGQPKTYDFILSNDARAGATYQERYITPWHYYPKSLNRIDDLSTWTYDPYRMIYPTNYYGTGTLPLNTQLLDNLYTQRKDPMCPQHQTTPPGNSIKTISDQRNTNTPLQFQGSCYHIDLTSYGVSEMVYGTATLGYNGAWVKSWHIAYSDFTDTNFHLLRDANGNPKVFSGNTNDYEVVRQKFTVPVRAQNIRMYPKSYHGSISARMRVIGIKLSGEVVSAAGPSDPPTCSVTVDNPDQTKYVVDCPSTALAQYVYVMPRVRGESLEFEKIEVYKRSPRVLDCQSTLHAYTQALPKTKNPEPMDPTMGHHCFSMPLGHPHPTFISAPYAYIDYDLSLARATNHRGDKGQTDLTTNANDFCRISCDAAEDCSAYTVWENAKDSSATEQSTSWMLIGTNLPKGQKSFRCFVYGDTLDVTNAWQTCQTGALHQCKIDETCFVPQNSMDFGYWCFKKPTLIWSRRFNSQGYIANNTQKFGQRAVGKERSWVASRHDTMAGTPENSLGYDVKCHRQQRQSLSPQNVFGESDIVAPFNTFHDIFFPCPMGQEWKSNRCNLCRGWQYVNSNGHCQDCPLATIPNTERNGCVSDQSVERTSTSMVYSKYGLAVTCTSPNIWNGVACVACAPGTVWENMYSCKSLERLYWQTDSGQESVSCPAGEWLVHGKTCAPCPMGTYEVSDTCQDCPLNTWSNTIGATSEAACIQCFENTVSEPGSSRPQDCKPCRAGQQKITCAQCSSTDPISILDCYASTEMYHCDNAFSGDQEHGWVADLNDNSPWIRFDFGTPKVIRVMKYRQRPNSEDRSTTAELQFSTGEIEYITLKNTAEIEEYTLDHPRKSSAVRITLTSDDNAVGTTPMYGVEQIQFLGDLDSSCIRCSDICTDCEAGQYSDNAGSECRQCPTGETSLPGSSACYKKCPIGTYHRSENICEDCPSGTTSVAGSLSCKYRLTFSTDTDTRCSDLDHLYVNHNCIPGATTPWCVLINIYRQEWSC